MTKSIKAFIKERIKDLNTKQIRKAVIEYSITIE